jgi:predicted AAA+ superfamily ATPase
MGTERLPGRRGQGRDFVQLPMSLRTFCESVIGLELPDESVEVADWLTPAGRRFARELYLQAEALSDAIEQYVRIGGFPGAVRDDLRTGNVSDATVRMLWDVVAGDIRDGGYDGHSALRLLERVGVSLGSPVAWDNLKEAMGVASHDTARRHTHLLSESFVLLTVFHWAMGGAFEPARQRKLYFLDPLFARIAPTLIPGGHQPASDGLLENLVATALYASASDRLTLADPLPGAIGYWKSRDGRETDFVAPTDAERRGYDRIPVEVKGDSRRGVSGARLSMQRSFGRGIVVTRREFELADIPAIPIGVFLAGLAPRTERRAADP